MLRNKLLIFTLTALLIVLYFWGHNIGTQAIFIARLIQGIGQMMLDLATVGLVAVASGTIGRRVVQVFAVDEMHRAERVALESLLGLGLISSATLLLGMAGIYSIISWLIVLLPLLIFHKQARQWLADFRGILSAASQPTSPWTRFIVIFAGLMLGGALLLALAPPIAWDSLTYHLVGPARYIAEGQIATQADNPFLGFPQQAEVLYGLVMLPFGSDVTPALLHFYFGTLALMAVAGLVTRMVDATAGAVSALLFLSSYSLWMLFGWPYVDLAVMAYGAATLLAILHWHDTDKRQWLLLAGLAAGMAFGVKYTAASLFLAVGMFLLWHSPRRVLQNGFWFGFAALMAFAPWMLKGMLLYGNPVYPYIFGGVNWDSIKSMNFNGTGAGLLSQELNLQLQLPVLPIAATIFGAHSYSPYSFTVGPWLLTMPFLLIFVWKQLSASIQDFSRAVLIFALPILAFWYVLAATSGIGAQPRLFLAGAPAAAVLGAIAYYGLTQLPRQPLNIAFLVHGMLIFTIFLVGMDALRTINEKHILDYNLNPVPGNLARNQYLHTNLSTYYGMMLALDELPEGSRVLFLWEPKTYHCPAHVECIGDIMFDQWSYPLMQGQSIEELLAQWRENGVDYFMVLDAEVEDISLGYSRWLELHTFAYDVNRLFPEVLETYFQLEWTDETMYHLYSLK